MKQWGETKKRLEPYLNQGQRTRAIHGGQEPEPVTGSVAPPLYQTSTYAQKEPAKPYGEFEYSRSQNPTRRSLEDCLALLENGVYALATASGMGATSIVTALLHPGDELITCDDLYGGTYRFAANCLKRNQIQTRAFDFLELEKDDHALERFASDKTKMIWVESPTNPLFKIYDLEKIAQIAKKNQWIFVVDNTFASSIFQKPLDLGADVVIHSLTKYAGGHSDLVAGAIVTSREDLAEKFYFEQNNAGSICSPFDSWLLLRSLKTLPLRMKAHEENAVKMAQYLEESSFVEKVLYPGLPSHPQHKIASKQMSGFGGMLSFYLQGGFEESSRFLSKLKIFTLAESLGGVESLIEHPASMTHASIPAEVRTPLGIGDNLIRVSVGLEDFEDMKRDFEEAFH